MFYLVLAVILVRLIIFLMPKTRQKKMEKKVLARATEQILNMEKDKNPYEGLRNQAFSVSPEQLKIALDETKTVVFGIIMDWDIGDAVITVVAFLTGEASIYFSTGQVFIGGFAHENIKKAALHFVYEAQKYLFMAALTYTNPYPDKGYVRFLLRTNKGEYTFQENAESMQASNSEYARLFKLGNNLITEYRIVSERDFVAES